MSQVVPACGIRNERAHFSPALLLMAKQLEQIDAFQH
ncbi:hypothetical protein ExPUPEC119_01244 [Escherichia coli]|nr:hypothetical protein ExPUPEC119_01244 [Escherichia coli]